MAARFFGWGEKTIEMERREEEVMNRNSERNEKKIPNKDCRYIIIRKFIAFLYDGRWNKNNSVQFQSEPNT